MRKFTKLLSFFCGLAAISMAFADLGMGQTSYILMHSHSI